MEINRRREFLINTLYFLTIAALIFFVSRFMLKYLTPFIVAVLAAWTVQKPAHFISKKLPLDSKLCAGIMSVLFFATVVSLLFLILFAAVNATTGLFSELSKKTASFAEYFTFLKKEAENFFAGQPADIQKIAESFIDSFSKRAVTGVTSLVSSLAQTAVKKTPAIFISCVVSAVASFYIAADFYGLLRFLRSLFGRKIYENTLKVKRIFTKSVLCYFKGYSLLLAITFSELCAGLLILRVKYAVFLALLISLVDILPVLGTGTVLVPWGIAAAIMGNTRLCIGIFILYLLITVVRNFAEPKIIGKQIGINPLFTLLTMFIGARISGFVGMMLFPIAFIVVVKYYREELKNDNAF